MCFIHPTLHMNRCKSFYDSDSSNAKRKRNEQNSNSPNICVWPYYTHNSWIKSYKTRPHCRKFVFWRIISIFCAVLRVKHSGYGEEESWCIDVCMHLCVTRRGRRHSDWMRACAESIRRVFTTFRFQCLTCFEHYFPTLGCWITLGQQNGKHKIFPCNTCTHTRTHIHLPQFQAK